MIILIAGASHTGKTAFGQRLSEAYQYPYFSMDHLIRSGNIQLTPLSDDEALTASYSLSVPAICCTPNSSRQIPIKMPSIEMIMPGRMKMTMATRMSSAPLIICVL